MVNNSKNEKFIFSNREMNLTLFIEVVIIGFVTFAVLGGVIAFFNEKSSKSNDYTSSLFFVNLHGIYIMPKLPYGYNECNFAISNHE